MTCRFSSRRSTQCPLFPTVQHFFTAAAGDPSTLKAPLKAFTDFTNMEGWADTQAREIPRLEPPLAALLCPGAGWGPDEKPLPPDRLQKQIVGLTDSVHLCLTICGGGQQPRPALLCPGLLVGWQGGLRPGGSRKEVLVLRGPLRTTTWSTEDHHLV
ncbi:unnamed protein product [Boreogadus saida]